MQTQPEPITLAGAIAEINARFARAGERYGERPLTKAQLEILDHTVHRAAGGFFCGGSKSMDSLVELGLMKYAGRKSFVPDPYYTITEKGRAALAQAERKPQSIEPSGEEGQ